MSLDRKKIAVIGANKPLLPFYRQARNLGYYIIGIAWEEGAVCKAYCDKFYPVSFQEKETVLEICKKEQINGITSFSLESALPTLVYVAQSMGLVSNTIDCVALTKDKYSMRNAFQKADISVPRFYLIEDVAELGKYKYNYPVIVKPVDGGGSQGINKVDSFIELAHAYEEARSKSRIGKVIIEEFIDGREFSVEYISHKGKHYCLQITDKVTSGAPHFIEVAHHQPANVSIEIANAIKNMVERALTALRIENSSSHTEIKLNSHGELYIIEIGARMGGDYITSDLVRLSTGYDMVKGVIDLAIGNFVEPVISTNKHSGVYFYSKLAPYIKDIIVSHDRYPEIVEWELDNSELKEALSNADRNGYFIYQANKRLEF